MGIYSEHMTRTTEYNTPSTKMQMKFLFEIRILGIGLDPKWFTCAKLASIKFIIMYTICFEFGNKDSVSRN